VTPFCAAGFRERDPLNRAIATDADRTTQKSIAGDLAWDAAAIELEDNFVTRQLAQIGAILHALFVNANFTEADFSNEFGCAPLVGIKNCDRLLRFVAQFFCSKKRRKVMPSGNGKLACADEYSGTMLHRPVPIFIFNRVRRWDEFNAVGAERTK